MKPELIVTDISILWQEYSENAEVEYKIMPAEVKCELKINLQGRGDFSQYINKAGKMNFSQLMLDILEGDINMSGKNNMNRNEQKGKGSS